MKSDPVSIGDATLIAVVGADGFVGHGLASAFGAKRIVYGPTLGGDTHITKAEKLIRRADVVINCGGFRVRPGLGYADYQRSHEGSTSAFAPWLRKDALLLHVSSTCVLGKGQGLGNHTPANPKTFPSPAYALAKFEEDCYLERVAAERGLQVVFLRPATVYSTQGAGMVDTMLKLAKRGIALRLHPREARHHLVHMSLLAAATRRIIIQRNNVPNLSTWVLADPYTITNRELEAMIHSALQKKYVPLPLPAHWISTLLQHTFRSRNPKFDLKTWGEIFGVLAMNTVYDPEETFHLLGIDPSQYTVEKTLRPLIYEALTNETGPDRVGGTGGLGSGLVRRHLD
jgi:nucleoside-diphosphate-sugar epimerase